MYFTIFVHILLKLCVSLLFYVHEGACTVDCIAVFAYVMCYHCCVCKGCINIAVFVYVFCLNVYVAFMRLFCTCVVCLCMCCVCLFDVLCYLDVFV